MGEAASTEKSKATYQARRNDRGRQTHKGRKGVRDASGGAGLKLMGEIESLVGLLPPLPHPRSASATTSTSSEVRLHGKMDMTKEKDRSCKMKLIRIPSCNTYL